MIGARAVEGGIDPVLQFVGGEQPRGLGDAAFAVDPVRLDWIEPGTLGWQEAGHDVHPTHAMNAVAVLPHPPPHRAAGVPRGVVPDQHQRPHPRCLKAGPHQSRNRGGEQTQGAPVNEAQPYLRSSIPGVRRTHEKSAAGQGFQVRVVAGTGLLLPARGIGISPNLQRRAGWF